jgi:hypothetical protein
MKRFVWLVPVAFVLGFAVAWSAKPKDRTPASTVSEVTATNSRTSSRVPRVSVRRPAMDRVKGYMRQIEDAANKKNYPSDLFMDIPVGDIPLLIEQWKKRAGFSGLIYNEQYQITKLVQDWYEKEPQAALDWVASMECKKDRQELISVFVSAEAKRNFDRALELAKQYGTVELGGLKMPSEVQKKLGECDPERITEILRMFPTDNNARYGGELKFKENFDFAKLAAALDKDYNEHKEQMNSFHPANFVTEWAKIDPEAAYDWISKEKGNHKLSYGEGDIASALNATRSRAQINKFLIEQIANGSDDDSKFRLAWWTLAKRPDDYQIADFISRLPGDRGTNLERLAKSSIFSSGGSYDEFKEKLVAQMTSDERKLIIPKVFGPDISKNNREILAGTLRQLGHTDAEINEILPQTKEE